MNLPSGTGVARRGVLASVFLLLPILFSCGDDDVVESYPENAVRVSAEGNVSDNIKLALIEAKSGDFIVLPKGRFSIDSTLSFDGDADGDGRVASNITIAGHGRDGTILDFSNSTAGDSIFIDNAVGIRLRDFTVLESNNNAIKIKDSNGVHLKRVGAVWEGEPDSANGAYGFYPVESSNIVIEDSYVRGAADAGIYVGQSEYIVVRNNLAEKNVAGIEIENSKYADVYDNEAKDNTGGILVFDLPIGNGHYGGSVRVFSNDIHDNNTENFANTSNNPAGVHITPPGSGMIVLSTSDVEIFDNDIHDNETLAIAVSSFLIAEPDFIKFLSTYAQPGQAIADGWRPIPRRINVHDNDVHGNGSQPRGELIADLISRYVAVRGYVPHMLYDGLGEYLTGAINLSTYGITEPPFAADGSDAVCFSNNGFSSIGRYMATTSDTANADVLEERRQTHLLVCDHDPLPLHVATVMGDTFGCGVDHPHEHCDGLHPVGDGGAEGDETPDTAGNLHLCDNDSGSGVNWAAVNGANCPSLSDYNLFVDATDPTGATHDGGLPYDLNTPLFTDYTSKYRYVFIPQGATATYSEREVFDFPVGTVLVKTFALPANADQRGINEELIETRLLIRRSSGWITLPYVWNSGKTDAVLRKAGAILSKTIIQGGQTRQFNYVVPSSTDCKQCHEYKDAAAINASIVPIGPKARHLNKTYNYTDGAANQLSTWVAAGWLSGAPADLSTIDTIPAFADADAATLGAKTSDELMGLAKGYLDINCAHCHRPEGNASNTGLTLEHWRPYGNGTAHGACKQPIAYGGGNLSYDVVPGDALQSIMAFRVNSNVPGDRMPEIGRSLVHDEGVQLIQAWINSLPAAACSTP